MDREFLRIINNEVSVSVTNSKIESVRNKKIERASVRVFDSGCVGISATSSNADFGILENYAKDALQLKVPSIYELPEGNKRTWDTASKSFTEKETLDVTEKIIEELNKTHPDFIFSGNIQSLKSERHLENSKGADYVLRKSYMYIGIIFKHAKSLSILDGGFGNVYYNDFDIKEFTDKFSAYLNAFNNEVKIEDSSIPVVFWEKDPFNFFLKHLNGELIEKGTSYFSDKIGKKIFSEDFTLYDINYDPEHHIADPFDGDGFVRKDHILPIIEAGTLNGGLYDLRRAAIYKKQATGTSVRAYNKATEIYPNNLFAKQTGVSLKDLKRAILVFVSSGGDFQDDGSISLPIQLGYLIENGKIIGKTQELILTNTIEKMFTIDYIGSLAEGMFENEFEKFLAIKMNIQKG